MRPDHPAAEHFHIQADLIHRPDDADGIGRIRSDEHQIRRGRLNRADNRRVILRRWGIGLVVDDFEFGACRQRARAINGIAGELGIGSDQSDGLGPGIHRGRDLEEWFRQGFLGMCSAGGNDREIIRVVELTVHIQTKHSDHGQIALYRRGHEGGDQVGALAAEQKIHLVDVQQFGDDTRHERRVRLVVIGEQFYLPAKQTSFGIGILDPDLHAQENRPGARGQPAGLADAHPEGEGFRCLSGGARQHGGRQQAAGEA